MTEPAKRKVLATTIILTAIPAILLVRFPSLLSARTILLYLSAIFGYLGIISLLWSYVLGAKSVMGIIFHDLAPILHIHKWLGKYGTLAIFIHPLLVMYSYGENLLYLVVPRLGTEFDTHVTLGRIAFLVCLFIWFTSAIIRNRIKFRPWRYLHMLGYIALPFAFLHVPDVGSQFMSSTLIKAYLYIIIVVFFIFSLLRLRGLLNVSATRYHVNMHQRLVDEEPEVYLIELTPEAEKLVPKAGEYVYLKFSTIMSEAHPFSVFDYDEKTGNITIAYRIFGRFTDAMSELKSGDSVLLTGPYGTFTEEITAMPEDPTVFIAGGIGVTPLVRHLTAKSTREQWLFYANRTEQSAMLLKGLRRLLGPRLITIFSREQYTGVGDEHGHFTAAIARKYLVEPQGYRYYICGSEAMMRSVIDELRELGVPAARIHSEVFGW